MLIPSLGFKSSSSIDALQTKGCFVFKLNFIHFIYLFLFPDD